jgi:hypothetical protein
LNKSLCGGILYKLLAYNGGGMRDVYGQSSGPGGDTVAVPAVKNNVAVTPELQKNAVID